MLGKHKEAYDAIASHDFQTWEGAEGKITAQFKISLLEQAREALHEGDGAEAEKLAWDSPFLSGKPWRGKA